MIFLKDALVNMGKVDEHKNPVPFSLVFCTANRSKKTGGEIIRVEKAVFMKKLNTAPAAPGSGAGKRQANEYENATRNIWCLTTERPYKVHIRLIDEFNSQVVVW